MQLTNLWQPDLLRYALVVVSLGAMPIYYAFLLSIYMRACRFVPYPKQLIGWLNPFDYATFLEFSASIGLLHRTQYGYAFAHAEIESYFASL